VHAVTILDVIPALSLTQGGQGRGKNE